MSRPTTSPPPKRTGRRLLSFDRRLGARYVAGADEAGRGSLAGPLVVAGVLLDYGTLRDHRVRPLAYLNDSKELDIVRREELFRAVVACAERVSIRVVTHAEIDRAGLHASNLASLRQCCTRSRRRPRSASSTASGSARRRPSTSPSSAATAGAPRSPPPRSSRRSSGTASCAASTRSSRSTASRPTSATSRRVTRRASASTGRPRSTGMSFAALCYQESDAA